MTYAALPELVFVQSHLLTAVVFVIASFSSSHCTYTELPITFSILVAPLLSAFVCRQSLGLVHQV